MNKIGSETLSQRSPRGLSVLKGKTVRYPSAFSGEWRAPGSEEEPAGDPAQPKPYPIHVLPRSGLAWSAYVVSISTVQES